MPLLKGKWIIVDGPDKWKFFTSLGDEGESLGSRRGVRLTFKKPKSKTREILFVVINEIKRHKNGFLEFRGWGEYSGLWSASVCGEYDATGKTGKIEFRELTSLELPQED